MGIFNKILGGGTNQETGRPVRYNCRACSTKFEHDDTADTDAECPECGETERVFRL